jgi:hypothetical protein
VVVVESAPDEIFVKEAAMLFAVPILIAVSLFLLWTLVKLTLNAMPLFVGVSLGFLMLSHGEGLVAALISGVAVAIAVTLCGAWTLSTTQSPGVKLMVAAAFAGPAAFVAYHAVRGLAVLVIADGTGATCVAVIAAVNTGWSAYARVADKGRQTFLEVPRST